MHRHLAVSACVLPMIAVLAGWAWTASAATGTGASPAAIGEPWNLVLLPEHEEPGSVPSVRVIHSGDEGLQLEFALRSMTAQPLEVGRETYHVVQIEGGGLAGAEGEPMLPTFSRLIQIPARAGVSVEVIDVETTEFADLRPFPMQPEGAPNFVINEEAYLRAGCADAERAMVGEPAIARDLRVVPITFSPVRYHPARQSLEVASRIRVNVRFAGEDMRNVKERHRRVIPASFDRLYRSLVVNYTGPRGDQIIADGTYVIICPNNSSVLEALEPLVEWRTRKGSLVHLVTTTESGSSREDIRAWLQNAYDTWEHPPEFVCLVGDVSGGIPIPCWFYSSAETDHPYVQLDGGDVLADAHIGRISVDTVDRLRLYVTKIVGYESTPYMTETDWYTRGCVVGDPSSSGYTCIQVMQWLKSRLLDCGYTEVDTVFSPPWVSQMVSALNRGDTVFSYRGFYGTSGFGIGNIFALTNGWKMPFAPMITCGTGNFSSGTCISEAWMRAGIPPSTPTGGIAGISTSGGTHTRYNNCAIYGIWRGILWEEMYTFGESLTRAKYELYINYAQADPGGCANFTNWNNLMGDAAGEIWTGVPQAMDVDHPSVIPFGANSVTVSANLHGSPCEGALVCLWKGDETYVRGHTGADGSVELAASALTEGEMKVTVTKHDHHPYLGALGVEQQAVFVGYLSHVIDDDNTGSSSGNDDGQVNPTERIELGVQVQNFGWQTAYGVEGTLTIDDPYVTIPDNQESFGDISPGGTASSGDDFDIEVAAGAPNGHLIHLGLDLESGNDIWRSLIEIPVVAAEFHFSDVTLYDFGSRIDPGESGQISVRIENAGGATGSGVVGTLLSRSQWVTVDDGSGTFGTIAVGSSGENIPDHFGLSVDGHCFQGHIAPMLLTLEFSAGAIDTVHFVLEIGQASSQDPTGPDAYGYYAFDNTDTNYPYAPTYNWIEIDPGYGGSGTSLGLYDDSSETVTLPFPFTYYGDTFTRATICMNGWIAMGSTYLTNYRNWNIPGAGALEYMIAPMWDNLYPYGSNTVYHLYDGANHRYIVQWSRVRNAAGSTMQNFEVILYDPAHHTTETGDGMILFQYDTFNNSDNIQHYSTTGIENGDMTDGVLYGYFNRYNTGAASIVSGRAIKFLAFLDLRLGTLAGTITNATNGGTPLGGATVTVVPLGEAFESGPDGTYDGEVRVGIYGVVASHPSFEAQTAPFVSILEGETTIVDFALEDIAGPSFTGTTRYENTTDTEGPYDIYSIVRDHSAIEGLWLHYNANGSGWETVPLEEQGEDLYKGSIPGQPYTSQIHYYLTARDIGGNASSDPMDPPEQVYWFWVMPPAFGDDMEAGPGTWTHEVVTAGYVDQWHRSSARNHTPGGSWSWKFGDTGSGNYADMADGALMTEPIELEVGATLSFWHWMEAEVSGLHMGYAFDGGLVEISVNGGDWAQIAPVGGYPYRVREGGGPGPFPPETPIYSGSFDWAQAVFELEHISGSVQFRFRFGSDDGTGLAGWYIDDVQIVPDGPGAAFAEQVGTPPTRVALYQNRPNPLGALDSRTSVRFDLPQAAAVRLKVFDVSGRLVRTLVDGLQPSGPHMVSWNMTDYAGRPLQGGIYFYRLSVGRETMTKRMLLVR